VTTAASGKPAIAALLATIQGVSVVGHGAASIPTPGPHEIVVVDGQPDMDAVLRQIDQARPAMASVAPRMGILARRVVQGIATSYQSATVEHLADVAGCSARHLSRAFGRETGITLREYVARVRTEVGKALLTESTRAVEAIAEAAGFYDASHFAKSFISTRARVRAHTVGVRARAVSEISSRRRGAISGLRLLAAGGRAVHLSKTSATVPNQRNRGNGWPHKRPAMVGNVRTTIMGQLTRFARNAG
jgi:AraC-like DNA-binding protein